jgi:5'-methylthioadenosine nucleosidase
LVARLGLKRVEPSPFVTGAPMVVWAGSAAGVLLRVCWCGSDKRFGGNNVATTAAAVATYALIAAFGAPDLLLSAGTAGGFACAGAAVGDVFLSSKCVFHSRRIPGGGGELEEYGFGHFRSPPLGRLADACGLKLGVVSTSDSLDSTAMDLQLMRQEGAAVKEMEAAAVAWTCEQLRVPFCALKSITDVVDGPHATRAEFEANLHTASVLLQQKLVRVLELVAGTSLTSWAVSDGPSAAGASAELARGQDVAPRAQAAGGTETGRERGGRPGGLPGGSLASGVVIGLLAGGLLSACALRPRPR